MPEPKADRAPAAYSLHGRRKGRKLRGKKPELMATLLPRLAIAADSGTVDPGALFPGLSRYWLEVGFGSGEHLAAQAAQNPSVGMIGCEPFVNGVASLLEQIDAQQIGNIRIFADDARKLLDALPAACLEKIFVLFPDPWPKKRHAVRRFIGPENLPRLARALKPGGELRVASDEPVLQEWMIEHLRAAPGLTPAPGTEGGIYPERPASWPKTRYEQKSLAKKKYEGWQGPRYYSFIRL